MDKRQISNFREKQIFATVDNFGMLPHEETITVIVFSYNRPRMLTEALMTLKGADQIIIVDDGSNFDPIESVNKANVSCDVSIVRSSPAPLEIRTKKPRIGKMTNQALTMVKSTLVTYLCDDDLLADGWLNTAKEWMSKRPACHIVKGLCRHFLEEEGVGHLRTMDLGGRGLTSGNFVHRIECFTEEGIMWPQDKLASVDDGFLWEVYKWHNTWMVPVINELSLYRRVHDNALSAFCFGYDLTVEGEKKLKAKVGDGISVEGEEKLNNKVWME